MKSQKASLNLAISYIVTIVLVLLMLFFAFRFFSSGLKDANQGIVYVDSVQRDQVLQRLSLENMRSFVLFNKETVLAGDSQEFVVGVKNNFASSKLFKAQILFAEGRDVNGVKLAPNLVPNNLDLWHRPSPIELVLDPGKSEVFATSIAPPKGTSNGEYIFEMLISSCEGNCVYYDRQVLKLEVE